MSTAARNIYSDVVAPKLSFTNPRRRHFTILEDKDPVGNQSKAGRSANRVSRLSLFRIPKRSPELNVMDFAVWSEIELRMRRQGRKFPKGNVETRASFLHRPQRTARNLPKSLTNSNQRLPSAL